MVNKKILLSVVIVLLIGVAAGGYQATKNTPGLWQPITSHEQSSTDQVTNTHTGESQSKTQKETTSTSKGSQSVQGGTTSTSGSQNGNGDNNVKISSQEAKSKAQKYILQPGAVAGTPKLQTIDGEEVYVVPILDNGKQVGEIWIDTQTGRNIGGAGGAP